MCFTCQKGAGVRVIAVWRHDVGGPSRSGRWQAAARSQSRNFADLIFHEESPRTSGGFAVCGIVRSRPIIGEPRELALARPLFLVFSRVMRNRLRAERLRPFFHHLYRIKIVRVVGEAGAFVISPDGHDAVIERDEGAASQFPHLERRRCLVGDVEALAVAIAAFDLELPPLVLEARRSAVPEC
jgi:hypothetical protein